LILSSLQILSEQITEQGYKLRLSTKVEWIKGINDRPRLTLVPTFGSSFRIFSAPLFK